MITKSNRWALPFVLISVLLDTIGIGIIIPVTPELIMEITGGGLADAAIYGGWLMVTYSAMQFFFAPIMGNLSDSLGRRPILLASMAVFAADYVLMGFAPTIFWLFIGRFIAGIAGSTATAANAFIADISPEEKRAQNFGLIGAAWGIGFILGPVIGGLLGEFGPRMPFFFCAALALINMVYGYFVLPETLAPANRRRFDIRRANPAGALLQMRRQPILLGLFAVIVLYQIAHDANPSIWTFYTMHRFGWSEWDVGLSLGVVGISITIVMGGLTRVIIPKIGEVKSVYVGFAFGAVGYFGFALAPSGALMLAFIAPFSLFGIAMPALRGIMSKQAAADAQGELQGTITSLISLTAVFSPMIMTQLFYAFSDPLAAVYFPGAPFLLAGLLMAAGLTVVVGVQRAGAPAAAR